MRIFVANIPYSVTSEILEDGFSHYGQVADAHVIMDYETGRSRGFGFIEMPNRSEGEAAILALDGGDWSGRRIIVQPAKPHLPGTAQRRPGAPDKASDSAA